MPIQPTAKIFRRVLFFLLGSAVIVLPLFVLPYSIEFVNLPKTILLFFLVAFLLLLWGVASVLQKSLVVKRSMLDLPLALFVAFIFLSALLSLSGRASFLGNTESFTLHILTFFSPILWCFLLIQIIQTKKQFSVFSLLLFCAHILALIVFLLLRTPLFAGSVQTYLPQNFFNTVSQGNSIFGIWVAALGVFSFGFLLLKGRRLLNYFLPGLSALLSLVVLFRLGFTVVFVVYAVGLGVVLVLPFLFPKFIHVKVALLGFLVFLLTLFSIVFSPPKFVKYNLPVEIALGAEASGDITKKVLEQSVKQFLFGSGPSTFVYDFSLHRTPAFNTNALVSEARFHSPFSTFLAILSELGVIGALFFILLVLIGLGALFSTWVELRSSFKESLQEKAASTLHHPSFSSFSEMFDVFVIGAAWLCVTVGLFLSFVDLTVWWLWWTLLGLILSGIGFVNKKFVGEHKISLSVSPQYSLALSFGIIFFFTLIILSSAFGVRLYLAEYFFSRASKVASLNEAEYFLTRAIEYRKSYAPYQLSLARVYLQKAKKEYETNPNNSAVIAQMVAHGANLAKAASELDPKNVDTWETLALLYINARSFASEANTWAKDALYKAILLEPSSAINHLRLADVHLYDKAYAEAEKEYKQAVELKYDSVPAYVGLVSLYRDQGKLTEAIALYEPLLKLVPNNAEVLYNYGILFYNRRAAGDDERAEAVWLEAIKILPNYSNALYSLGLLAERQGDKAKALQYYQKVRELNPQNQDVKTKIQSLVR